MLLQVVGIHVVCLLSRASAAYDPSRGFSLGVFGPFTSWNHELVAAAVAFDLDFRKNFEPAVAARLGPPVINISNIHPNLTVTIQIGTSHTQPAVGLRTALNWLQGTSGSRRVVGLVGGAFSFITIPIASISAIFEVPQVSWGASSPLLSDKQQYPFFCRTMAPDNLAGFAMWSWRQHFEVPSVAVFYGREQYGTGVYESIREAAGSADELDLLTGVGIPFLADVTIDNIAPLREACGRLRATGHRFVLLIYPGVTPVYYVLEQERMLYIGKYQFVGYGPGLQEHPLYPSMGWQVGFQSFRASNVGPMFGGYRELWSRMSTSDLYGEEARERYNMQAMQEPLLEDPALAVTNQTFTWGHFDTPSWETFAPFAFDASYTFVLAINSLLHQGHPPDEIKGRLLLEEVKRTQFLGVTGEVSFDENGDRMADYSLYSSRTGYDDFVLAGIVNPTKKIVRLMDPNGIMWVDGTINVRAPESLMACDPGRQWDARVGRCMACPQGFVSVGGTPAESECRACVAGTMSNANATACTNCSSGWYSARPGEDCSQCLPGSFAEGAGASACQDCDVGTFIEIHGASACERCGRGLASESLFTTMIELVVDGQIEYLYAPGAATEDLCGCDRHAKYSSGECVPCTEGLVCRGMGSVIVEEGYYSKTDLSVFRCFGDSKRCPSGLPGAQCRGGRTSLTCAECKDGMTPGSGGKCNDCESKDAGPFMAVVIGLCLCLVLAYHFIDTHNRATHSHALLLCSLALAQFITICQQMSVVGRLSLEWQEPMRSFFDAVSLLAFNLEELRLSCVGQVEPITRYVMKAVAIFIGIFLVVLIHCMFVVVRHKGRFAMQTPVLIGAVGALFMVFYISVTSAVLEPVQCLKHPNNKWTVRAYPTIICWESGQHAWMMAISGVVFAVVPVGFLVGTALVVREFPKRLRMGDSRAVRAFAFLFFRFRPQCHTYVLVHVLRSFFLAVVLAVPHVMLQLLFITSFLLGGFATTLLWLPWRVVHANVLDSIFSCLTILIIALSSAYIDEDEKNLEGIAELCLVLVVLVLALAPAAVLFGLWKRYLRVQKPFAFFLCHHKLGSGAWTRLLKLHLLDSGKVKSGVFVDSDNLDNLDKLFSYVGSDTNNFVVVGTQEIFKRAWCVGEMCTAMMKSVKTIVLSMPDFSFPEDHFIEEFEARVTNLEVLIESGITVEIMRSALRWIKNQPQIKLPVAVTVQVMDEVVHKLCSGPQGTSVVDVAPAKQQSKNAKTIIICDMEDMEAVATSLILQRMVAPILSLEANGIPKLMRDEVIPSSVLLTMVICTNLSFTRVEFLNLLFQLRSVPMRFLPIIAESAFQIPGKGFGNRLLEMGLGDKEVILMQAVLVNLFKMIGATFQPQSTSEAVLKVSAAEIAKQIKNPVATKITQFSGSNVITSSGNTPTPADGNPAKLSLKSTPRDSKNSRQSTATDNRLSSIHIADKARATGSEISKSPPVSATQSSALKSSIHSGDMRDSFTKRLHIWCVDL